MLVRVNRTRYRPKACHGNRASVRGRNQTLRKAKNPLLITARSYSTPNTGKSGNSVRAAPVQYSPEFETFLATAKETATKGSLNQCVRLFQIFDAQTKFQQYSKGLVQHCETMLVRLSCDLSYTPALVQVLFNKIQHSGIPITTKALNTVLRFIAAQEEHEWACGFYKAIEKDCKDIMNAETYNIGLSLFFDDPKEFQDILVSMRKNNIVLNNTSSTIILERLIMQHEANPPENFLSDLDSILSRLEQEHREKDDEEGEDNTDPLTAQTYFAYAVLILRGSTTAGYDLLQRMEEIGIPHNTYTLNVKTGILLAMDRNRGGIARGRDVYEGRALLGDDPLDHHNKETIEQIRYREIHDPEYLFGARRVYIERLNTDVLKQIADYYQEDLLEEGDNENDIIRHFSRVPSNSFYEYLDPNNDDPYSGLPREREWLENSEELEKSEEDEEPGQKYWDDPDIIEKYKKLGIDTTEIPPTEEEDEDSDGEPDFEEEVEDDYYDIAEKNYKKMFPKEHKFDHDEYFKIVEKKYKRIAMRKIRRERAKEQENINNNITDSINTSITNIDNNTTPIIPQLGSSSTASTPTSNISNNSASNNSADIGEKLAGIFELFQQKQKSKPSNSNTTNSNNSKKQDE